MLLLYKRKIHSFDRIIMTKATIMNASLNGMEKIQEMKRAPIRIKPVFITIEPMIMHWPDAICWYLISSLRWHHRSSNCHLDHSSSLDLNLWIFILGWYFNCNFIRWSFTKNILVFRRLIIIFRSFMSWWHRRIVQIHLLMDKYSFFKFH